ncbi:MAG TPA: hypothetical protein PLU35_14415 [Phycisphaerales bacterium]|nr:hypothetical protein [Phycisphaerales bacterium]
MSLDVFTRAAAATVMALASFAHAQRSASFFGLGDLPGGDINSSAAGLSADGSTVVGWSLYGGGFPGLRQAFRWNEEGMVGIGTLPGGHESHANRVSGDGRWIVGNGSSSEGGQAFRWSETTGMIGLGDLPGSTFYSEAAGVSDDGTFVVGWSKSGAAGGPSNLEAFRWTPETGMVGLGFMPGHNTSIAFDISADGRVIAGASQGSADGEAFLWTHETGMVGLGKPDGWWSAAGLSLSDDGTTVVGEGSKPQSGIEALRWRADTGWIPLGHLTDRPDRVSVASGVSPDGSFVVGRSTAAIGGEEAFVWSEEWGMRSVREVLLDFGIDTLDSGWWLSIATGVTIADDTLIITGRGWDLNHPSHQEAWIAYIPIPATASLAPLALAALTMRRRR